MIVLTDDGEAWIFDHDTGNEAITLYHNGEVGHYEYLKAPTGGRKDMVDQLLRFAKQHKPGQVRLPGGGPSKQSLRYSDFDQASAASRPKPKVGKTKRLSDFDSVKLSPSRMQ